MRTVHIYVDGSTWPQNPGNGGWGAVLKFGGAEKLVSGYLPNPTTNNQAETVAVTGAIDSLTELCYIILYTDSQYVFLCLKKLLSFGWLPKTNKDQWRDLSATIKGHEIKIVKIKGHSKNRENDIAHDLAYNAARNKIEVSKIVKPKTKTN